MFMIDYVVIGNAACLFRMGFFETNLKSHLKPLVEQSKGSLLVKLVHYDDSLIRRSKCYSFGMKFIDNSFECNYAATLQFSKVSTICCELVPDLTKEAFEEATSLYFYDLTASSTQDYTKFHVANKIDLAHDKYERHHGDKIEKSDIGEVVRSSNKVIVNLFSTAHELFVKMCDQAHNFTATHSNRINDGTFTFN